MTSEPLVLSNRSDRERPFRNLIVAALPKGVELCLTSRERNSRCIRQSSFPRTAAVRAAVGPPGVDGLGRPARLRGVATKPSESSPVGLGPAFLPRCGTGRARRRSTSASKRVSRWSLQFPAVALAPEIVNRTKSAQLAERAIFERLAAFQEPSIVARQRRGSPRLSCPL